MPLTPEQIAEIAEPFTWYDADCERYDIVGFARAIESALSATAAPPASWDQYALEQAQWLWNLPEMPKPQLIAALQCALIEAMRFAAPPAAAQQPDEAGREAEALQRIANRVCGEIPEGWELNLCMENGAGDIELIDPEGDSIDIDSPDSSLADKIDIALALALRAQQQGGGNG